MNEKKQYTPPAITFETDLETKAGSPGPQVEMPELEWDGE